MNLKEAQLFAVSLTLSLTLAVSSCAHSSPGSESSLKKYRLTGRVAAIDKVNKSLTVDGDEIPGFMSAMQMPYDVKDGQLLDRLAVGDKIGADIIVKGDESWLENVTVLQHAPTGKPSAQTRLPARATS
jgi:protein SCO1/2